MTRAAHSLAILLITAVVPPAGCTEAEDLIARMSATYKRMQPSLAMSAHVVKKVQSGGFWKETARDYRVLVSGDDFQVRLLGDSGSSIIRSVRAGRVMVHSSIQKQFSDHAQSDPEAREALQALAQYRITFFDRFLHLAQARPIVTSSKRDQLRVAKERKDCLRVGIKAPDGSEVKWRGTIWIERETGLVWRAQMQGLDDLNQQADEDVTWAEIRSGASAIPDDSVWLAPADTTRIGKWPYSLPR